jgi:hypothetical protein
MLKLIRRQLLPFKCNSSAAKEHLGMLLAICTQGSANSTAIEESLSMVSKLVEGQRSPIFTKQALDALFKCYGTIAEQRGDDRGNQAAGVLRSFRVGFSALIKREDHPNPCYEQALVL